MKRRGFLAAALGVPFAARLGSGLLVPSDEIVLPQWLKIADGAITRDKIAPRCWAPMIAGFKALGIPYALCDYGNSLEYMQPDGRTVIVSRGAFS